jgi:hypothetical protein
MHCEQRKSQAAMFKLEDDEGGGVVVAAAASPPSSYQYAIRWEWCNETILTLS